MNDEELAVAAARRSRRTAWVRHRGARSASVRKPSRSRSMLQLHYSSRLREPGPLGSIIRDPVFLDLLHDVVRFRPVIAFVPKIRPKYVFHAKSRMLMAIGIKMNDSQKGKLVHITTFRLYSSGESGFAPNISIAPR
jgi:hypothetical protein